MYLGENNGAVCMWKESGLGACTDHLNAPDALLAGDMIRMYDSATAPFEVHLYGVARDDVALFSFDLRDGRTVVVPVAHNAFSLTMLGTEFADIASVSEQYRNAGSLH